MPLSHVVDAIARHFAPPPVRAILIAATLALTVALAFAIGLSLGSPLSGTAAALATVYVAYWDVWGENLVSNLLYLTLAAFVVRRARRPSAWTSAAVGCSAGACVLMKSPIFLWPAAAAVWNRLADRERPWSAWAKDFAPLVLVPYLMLAPWIVMNAAVFHRFIPLENGRANMNLVTGVLGIVPTIDGNVLALADAGSGPPYAWAIRYVLAHPFAYAASCVGRLGFALSLHPILAALTLLGWRMRRSPETDALAGLSLYLVLVHCLISVEPRYLGPACVVATPLAAVPFAEVLSRGRRRPSHKPLAVLSSAALAASLSAAAATLVFLAAYPARRARADALDKALAAFPTESYLLRLKGEELLTRGEVEKSIESFRLAARYDPTLARAVDYAWARLQLGGPGSDVYLHIRVPNDQPELAFRLELIRAIAALDRGEIERASEIRADAEWRIVQHDMGRTTIRRASTALERATLETLLTSPPPLTPLLWSELPPFPPSARRRLLLALQKLSMEQGAQWMPLTAAVLGEGGPETGSAMPRLERLDFALSERWRFALLSGRRRDADDIFNQFTRLASDDVSAWKELQAAAESGFPDLAARAKRRLDLMENPEKPKLERERRRELAHLYQERRAYNAALKILNALSHENPHDPEIRNDLGVLRVLMGRRQAGAQDLREAIRLDPDYLPPYLSLASILVADGNPSDAAKLYESALARNGRPPEYRNAISAGLEEVRSRDGRP